MANRRVLASKTFTLYGAALLAISLCAAAPVSGQVRLTVPDQSPLGPFYARLSSEFVPHTDEWVAIAFYREPVCTRPDFNLMDFFDIANVPMIFGCPLTVHGFVLHDDPLSQVPKHSRLEGNGAVPVWFVSVEDFNGALPAVTRTKLLAMPSLVQGVATLFEETLHPFPAAKQHQLRLVAHGVLSDGRSFQYHALWTWRNWVSPAEPSLGQQQVRIEFR